jgi:ATP-binding protein involved in chromosome partitioning
MSDNLKEQVLETLSKISLTPKGGDIVSAGMIENVLVNEGKVIFSLKVPADQAERLEPLRLAAENAVSEIQGISSVTAVMTAERKQGSAPAASPAPAQPRTAPQSGSPRSKAAVPGVTSIIAVASGKGGVGKSTTTVNLALAIAAQGLSVGILDADIYGPSMPRMLGVKDKPTAKGKTLDPLEAFGMKVMSMGFLVDEESPMIWRGPMVISALTQMLREVAWGDLDVLVVDMPPGTGDVQLTMAQQVPLAGAVIVSTPQDIALIDARKGLNMFKKVDVPILGLIENMSTFICPKCGERSDIFGHGGARDEANRLDMEFLGEVPLHMDIRTNSDQGSPVVVSMPDSDHAKAYKSIAEKVMAGIGASNRSGPEIVFE